MKAKMAVVAVALGALTRVAAAQGSMGGMQMGAPVADALRHTEQRQARNLVAALESVPVDKWGYKPTPAQMSFAEIAAHLAEGNDYLCGSVSGQTAPTRDKVTPADGKDKQIARLKETFDFCESALAKLDDSKLGEEVPMFGGKATRAAAILITVGDWEDHYSQLANYLRLNGILPPTAQPKKSM